MAGFEVPSNILTLTFEQYPGLEVRARSVSLGKMLDLTAQAESLRKGTGDIDDARGLFVVFGERLISWNCTSDGDPVPATVDGLMMLDGRFASEIMLAWFDEIGGGDVEKSPLDRRFTVGLPSEVPSIPTEVLSESQPNFFTQS